MRQRLQKILCLAMITIGSFTLTSSAQTWTVGTPVNTTVITDFLGYGALTGCFPSATATWNFTIPLVSGIQFYAKVTAVDSNSCYIMPGNDTLQVGDSIAINSSSNSISLYCYNNSATTPVKMDLRAVGTPTTAGQGYACVPTTLLWMSNLGICPDGLGAQVPSTCNVMSGPTDLHSATLADYQFISPSVLNHYMAQLRNVDMNSQVSITAITGQTVQKVQVNGPAVSLNFGNLSNGIYIITAVANGIRHSEKVEILKD